MTKSNLLIRSAIAAAASVCWLGCNDVDFGNVSKDIQLDEKLVLPLGYAEANVGNIIEDNGMVGVYIDGEEIRWSVRDSSSYTMKPLLPHPFEISGNVAISAVLPSNTVLIATLNGYLNLLGGNDGDERIDSALINSLVANMKMECTDEATNFRKIEAVFEFDPTKIKHYDGSPVSETLTFNAFGETHPLALNNVKISNLTPEEGAVGIPMTVKLYLTANEGGTTIVAGSRMRVAADNFGAFDYQIAYGSFKPSELLFDVEEHFDFNIGDLDGAALKFYDPSILIEINSNVGADLVFDLDYLRAYKQNSTSGDTVYAVFSPDGAHQTSFVAGGTITPNAWRHTIETFDREHGATNLLFGQDEMPDRLEYHFSINVQQPKDENGVPRPMFITPNAAIKVYAGADIPIWLDKGSRYIYKDTIGGVSDSIQGYLDDLEKEGFTLNNLLLHLKLVNNFPLHAVYSMKLLDEAGKELSMQNLGLQDSYEIKMPKVSADGTVIEPAEQTIVFGGTDTNLIKTLKKIKSIAFALAMDGKSQEDVENGIHIHPSDSFRVNLGLYVDGTYKTTLKK
ncbi:MAG: hypothetical protein LBV31_03760 [Prevotellaceae bacterium]|jgi:hypothetical protein|nr:hypothetical protein [Prevotellaceae bacterium]